MSDERQPYGKPIPPEQLGPVEQWLDPVYGARIKVGEEVFSPASLAAALRERRSAQVDLVALRETVAGAYAKLARALKRPSQVIAVSTDLNDIVDDVLRLLTATFTEMSFIPTEQIVEELKKRFDQLIVAGSNRADEENHHISFGTNGGPAGSLGLCEYVKARVLANLSKDEEFGG